MSEGLLHELISVNLIRLHLHVRNLFRNISCVFTNSIALRNRSHVAFHYNLSRPTLANITVALIIDA